MPLIMLTGFPCAGKTKRALELAEYFKANVPAAKNVIVINDENLNINKENGYKSKMKIR